MEKNDSITPQENNKNRKTTIISLMVMAVLLIAELYVMTNMSWNIIALMIVTLLFLGSAYFFGNSILKEIQENKLRAEEQYDAITKANKASYILLKKAYEQLEEMESKSKKPTEEIITAQKAIAKVTISRNKENTDAMMNSNDKVLEKIFDFEENFGNNQNEMLDKQKIMIDDSMKELMIKQQEMASSMKAMEESIKSELLQAVSSIQVIQPAPTSVQVQEVPQEPMVDFVMEESQDLGMSEELGLDDGLDLGMSEEIGLDDGLDLGMSEEIGLDDSLDLGVSEELSLEDLGISEDMDFAEGLALSEDVGLESDLNLDTGLDLGVSEEVGFADSLDLGMSEEIRLDDGLDLGMSEEIGLDGGLDLGMSEELGLDGGLDLGMSEEIGFDDGLGIGEEVSLGDDFGIDSDLDLGVDLMTEEEPVVETVIEEVPLEPEFVAEEETVIPELSDPHKMMTPEEIAALIAKM